MTRIGVLALQGDVREHESALAQLGVEAVKVRRPAELESVDGIILPGGESTTIDKLLRAFDLFDPLRARIADGLPVLGSCAGMVLLADRIEGAAEGQQTLGGIPMVVRRNAFGRQIHSSEVELLWRPDGSAMHATFIRAPWVESADPAVQVLATVTTDADHIVAVRYGSLIATAFHPEISGDLRVHQMIVDLSG
jgi:5'-phosphate synthase pdxT subunit